MESDEFPHHSAEVGRSRLRRWNSPGPARLARPTSACSIRPRRPTVGESPHTVLQIVNDDMPFLVDTVTMSLAEQGVGVHVLGHPVLRFTRDKAGKLVKVGEGDAESVMLLEIDRRLADGCHRAGHQQGAG